MYAGREAGFLLMPVGNVMVVLGIMLRANSLQRLNSAGSDPIRAFIFWACTRFPKCQKTDDVLYRPSALRHIQIVRLATDPTALT